MLPDYGWHPAWRLGGVLTIATVVFHVIGLTLIAWTAERLARRVHNGRRETVLRTALILVPVVGMTFMLHRLEAGFWAIAHVRIGALPGMHVALLYSLGAMTTYGHAAPYLSPDWQLLGAIQSLNGMLVFGLTIAFMASLVRGIWPAGLL